MSQIVRSLLISTQDQPLLLPISVVAEITHYLKPRKTTDHGPNWLLGTLDWRHQQLPMIALETLITGKEYILSSKSHLLILYGLEASHSLPFYGFPILEVPRVLNLNEKDLTQPIIENQSGLAFKVNLLGKETVWLPDLTYIENAIRKHYPTNH